jgi:hypothetical protein
MQPFLGNDFQTSGCVLYTDVLSEAGSGTPCVFYTGLVLFTGKRLVPTPTAQPDLFRYVGALRRIL